MLACASHILIKQVNNSVLACSTASMLHIELSWLAYVCQKMLVLISRMQLLVAFSYHMHVYKHIALYSFRLEIYFQFEELGRLNSALLCNSILHFKWRIAIDVNIPGFTLGPMCFSIADRLQLDVRRMLIGIFSSGGVLLTVFCLLYSGWIPYSIGTHLSFD